MNENLWLTGTGPKWMLEHIRGRASPRKLRLFACASVRRIAALATPAGLYAVQMAEAFARGQASHTDAARASTTASHLLRQSPQPIEGHVQAIRNALEYMVANDPWDAAHAYVWVVAQHHDTPSARKAELAAQCDLLRCIFGNPYQSVQVQPDWLAHNDGAAGHLARSIDEEKRFEDLPILADALEEAGCDQAELLGHCRKGGTHAAGCWVLDLLLGCGGVTEEARP
jgi:hypothetical protein